MRIPNKVNEHQLFSPIWKKSATVATFVSPRTGRSYDWPIFRVDSQPVGVVFGLNIDHDVITIRQFRHAADAVIIELPGGLSNDGESVEDSARREFLEETGYKFGTFIPLAPIPIYFEPVSLDFKFQPFLALDCQKVLEQDLDVNEDIEIVLFPLSAWVDGIASGEIHTDAKSMTTTFLAMQKLKALGRTFY